jgi:hypothetical protein
MDALRRTNGWVGVRTQVIAGLRDARSGTRDAGIGNRESGIGNRESGIGNRDREAGRANREGVGTRQSVDMRYGFRIRRRFPRVGFADLRP